MVQARTPRLAPFAALSAALHVVAFGAAHRATSPTFDAQAQTLAGDTLDVDPAPPPPEDEAPDPAASEATSSAAPAAPPPSAGAPTASPAAPAARASAPLAAAAHRPPPLYGAVGERFATDLVTAFTRTFPQAASAERSWSSAPLGSAGRAEVTVWLDEQGAITGTSITGGPSPALRRGLERTLQVLAPRIFTAHGPVTRLRLAARVTSDDVHDGLHGDVFALSGGSFSGSVGTAFFALPPAGGPGAGGPAGVTGAAGRRVDLEVRLVP